MRNGRDLRTNTSPDSQEPPGRGVGMGGRQERPEGMTAFLPKLCIPNNICVKISFLPPAWLPG